MRPFVCVLLLAFPLFAQEVNREPLENSGAFFVDGIVHQFIVGKQCTVVAAAHAAVNRKFLAVKVRFYNHGTRSVTVRPEDVVVADAIGGRALSPVSGDDLARKMRKSYNMARYAVNNVAGAAVPDGPLTIEMLNPQMLEMMRAMSARGAAPGVMGRTALFTDTPGALDDGADAGAPVECDRACHLRSQEVHGGEPLAQVQRENSPESVERAAFLANTIPPRGNVGGLLYYRLTGLAEQPGKGARHQHRISVKVEAAGELFELELPVE
jgi:hypothetical protein